MAFVRCSTTCDHCKAVAKLVGVPFGLMPIIDLEIKPWWKRK